MKVNPLLMMQEEADGGGILFDPENYNAMRLNRSGAAIWKVFVSGGEAKDAERSLMDMYLIDEAVAKRDVAEFMEKLRGKGYLE